MIKRILLTVGIILALIGLGIGLLIYLFGKAMCGDDQIGRYPSPNSKHEIVNFRGSCGATSTFVYKVELDGKNVLRYTYGRPVSVKWIDNTNVAISMASSSPNMKIYEIVTNYKDIQVIFDENIKNARRVN